MEIYISTCNAGDPWIRKIPWRKYIGYLLQYSWASLVALMVKNLLTTQETCIQFLGWEDPRRRKWQPTAVFLPKESHGLRSLVG